MGGLQKELPERGGNTWIWEVVPTALTYFVFDFLSNLSDFFLGVFCQNVQLISNEVQPVLPIFSLLHGMDSTPAERKSSSPPCIPPGKNRPLARHGAPSWWFLSSRGNAKWHWLPKAEALLHKGCTWQFHVHQHSNSKAVLGKHNSNTAFRAWTVINQKRCGELEAFNNLSTLIYLKKGKSDQTAAHKQHQPLLNSDVSLATLQSKGAGAETNLVTNKPL